MCLVPTYTEIEKKNQINRVLNLMTLPLDTEDQKQNFLYNLSFMNNMVVKGYMKERTDMDERIYNVKDLALDYIVKQMPKRCFLSYNNSRYVIYICVNSRQYSFHTNKKHGMEYNLGDAREPRWDGIVGGWELSDAEYKQEMKIRKNTRAAERAQAVAERKEREIKIRKAVIHQIHWLQRNRQLVEEFKRVMEENITPAQRRTKTYKRYLNDKYNLYWRDCWKLWGVKWGFDEYPPETFFYAWKCTGSFFDKSAESYAKSFYEKVKSHYNF